MNPGERKIVVLKHFSDGLIGKQIADKLGVTIRVIENDTNFLKKLYGCTTLSHLIAYAIRNKLIE